MFVHARIEKMHRNVHWSRILWIAVRIVDRSMLSALEDMMKGILRFEGIR